MADENCENVIHLHGDLDLKILEARRLPNMDLVTERLRRCFTALDVCRKPFTRRRRKGHHRKIITSDPYVTVCLSGATVARTRVISNCQDPVWNEHFKIPLAHPVSVVEFQVKDNDVFGADYIGVATVPAQKIKSGELIDDWFPIIGPYGKPPKPDCAIRLQMKFTHCNGNPVYNSGISEDYGLKESYFPVRHGGSVTLYQDAHVPDGMLPEIKLDDNKVFEHSKCWEDICHAILEAHHLVYIVGWSIFHKVKLVREPSKPLPSGGDLTLGDLLKYKSEEGVRVLLLVWDDKTSHSKFFIQTDGLMCTHDEETRKFFKHSSVTCVLSPRYASSKLSIFKQQVVGTLYTHHQKCVIVDTQASGNNRKITAFLGGLDLCDGRYDTPEHRLFCDLDTVFKDDYHNPTFCVFRSIDSGSLKGFPKDVFLAESQNLVCAKNLVIDKSIQMGYIQAIRQAQHFIYIENQYFLGSSYAWHSYKDAGADNLIPMELALKIASKIREKERFSVYVVIPMWPEGVPTSASVQEILYWQRQTMKMMYGIIAQELKSSQLKDVHPSDYLNFYCLGNREELHGGSKPNPASSNGDVISASQKFGRFMIYVHAKGMIVDDEYVILGSANINQRSMAGSRDTEIAMGAYQPHHTWANKKKHPHGQVYGYRMSLWAEHMGKLDDCFTKPESLDCVKHVNKVAEDNWNRFTAEEFKPLQGHLLKYPVKVDSDGKVSSLPGHEYFPDVGGKVLGARTNLPDALTT
ncbi:phospholipase D delta-like isoform X2 [Nicotiana sylvestris]|uniref:phospholipase D delta-like isoform X2 n=1 Tax=Nicotiana sylvestris TaxID=4096 RepID=UPI00388C9096